MPGLDQVLNCSSRLLKLHFVKHFNPKSDSGKRFMTNRQKKNRFQAGWRKNRYSFLKKVSKDVNWIGVNGGQHMI